MTTDRTSGTFICIVCGESVSEAMSAACNWCDGRFHLNQRNDVEAKDCGQVWIDEQYMALQFACDNCLKGESSPRVESQRERAARPASNRPRRYRRRA
jgi:hypothetical protein